jgi:glycosyltransferase involved in cell wall biosynthesis/predicted SAM-dependent methyltransferase
MASLLHDAMGRPTVGHLSRGLNMTSELITFRYLKEVGGALSHESLAWLARIGALQEFVETGTYLGDTLATARSIFPTVHSIELSHELHARAQRRFAGQSGVHLYQGDSNHVLLRLLAKVGPAALVWLDACYSEGETARNGDGNTPIVSELEAIRASGRNDLWILVDDIRLFQPAGRGGNAAPSLAGYPGLDAVLGAVLAIDAGYEAFLVGDSLLAVPPGANAKASDVVRACTLSRFYGNGPVDPEEAIEAEAAIAAAQGEEAEALLQLPARLAASESFGLCGHYRLWRGLVLEARGDLAGAIDSFQRARRQGLADWRADWYLARATSSAGDLQAAADAAARAQELMPRQANAQVRATSDLETLRAAGLWTPGEPLRLHLGCGERRIDGYVNVDFPPTEHNLMQVAADVFADIAELDFPGASVDEIRCHHVFEHFGRVAALALLVRWHGWLKVGGRLWIETPDLEGSAKVILSDRPWREKMAAVRHLAGDQAAGWAYHLDLWFPERFERTLTAMGFEMESSGSWSWPHPPHLANVEVQYRKARHLDADALLAASEVILEESLVSRTEKPLLDTWKTQLRAALDGRLPGPGRQGPAPAGEMPPFPDWADTRTPLAELHDANQRTRDTWVRTKARAIPAGSRVLDVGAGTCPYRDAFAHCEYRTQDFKRYEGVKLGGTVDYGDIDYVSDIVAIPVPDASFDVVLCTEVLEHVPEPAAALREMARVLRPGGRLLLTAPLGSGLHQQPFHYYGGFTPHWYEHFAGECGLEIREVTPNGGMFALLAQECARVAWTMPQHQHLHGAATAQLAALFGEWLPRMLHGLDRQCTIDQFTIGYHVDAVKPARCGARLPEETREGLVGVIVSKDRPLQLDGTLRSFRRHAVDGDACRLRVLYRASSEPFADLYQALAAEHPGVEFVEERDFHADLLHMVRDSRHVLFIVDDNLFVSPFSLGQCVARLDDDPSVLGVSLRLGGNTRYCYTLNREQAPPDFDNAPDGMLRFRWPGAEADFGYPLEVSSSLYRTADLLPMLNSLPFRNPNTLEAGLASEAPRFAADRPFLCCYARSVAFCAPVNLVQDVCENRAGTHDAFSPGQLAELFATGHRIDVASYDGFVPNACHQEVELRSRTADASEPLVSVVIPCYRQAGFLEDAVGSVVAQSFADWECIVVDDGSPDDTAAVAERLAAAHPGRIRVLRQANCGLAEARNAAIRAARGRYVLPLDADDMLDPEYLARTVPVLDDDPAVAIVYVDEQNFGEAHHVHRKGESSLEALKLNNVHDYCSLYRRVVWESVGGYSPAMYLGGEDWNFWVGAAKCGYHSSHLPEPLFRYRCRSNTMVAMTLANLRQVHAQIILHHPDIYSESECADAQMRLSCLSGPNRERLRSAVAKSPGNRLLQRFEALAGGCATASLASPVSPGDEPLVSVIVVTKDRPRLLMDALASIIDQTYQRWEAVVVNDAGADIGELVASCDPEARVRYHRHTESLGLSAARNTGIGLSRGEILCYLDDDDRMLPDHLATVVRELQRTGSGIVYTEAERVIETLEADRRIEHRRDRPYSGISYSRERLHVTNFIPVNTFAHRRELLERTGLFDTGLSALEDWDLLLRMARETTFVRVPRVTVEVRQRAASGDDHLTARKRKDYPALFRQIYGRYPVDSAPGLEEARRLQLRALDDEVSASGVVGTYCQWVGKHALKESDAQYMAERMMLEWRARPTFHLLLAHETGMEASLADIVDSLASQLYHGWGLSVVSREPAPPGFDAIPKLEWIRLDGDLLEAVDSVVQQSTADWILLLEPGVRLAPEALFAIADYAQKFRAWQLVYSDEDRIGPDGERHSPLFKPDFNLDLLRSASYMGPLVWFRRELLVGIGGFREFGTATVYDAVFRALETAGESAVGHVAKVLFHRSDRHHATGDVSDEHQCGLRVVEQHLERLGMRATVCAGLAAGTHEVEYGLERMPKVSVIVPTRDQATLLRACVDGVVGLTNYPDFELLIVDNGSTEPEALAYLEEIPVRDPRVRVLRYDEPYSFSAINNFAASQASGELLLLLNNDTEVLHEDWMTQMVRHALRPEIGAVGVRLVYPDGRIQHAGVVLGMTSTADHPEAGTPMEEAGYMGRLQVAQNWSAVTAACLMVRKELYQSVGGLDEKDFNVLFNDVDFCLKLVTAGYRNVWTPHATLVHHASVSLKANADAAALERAQREREALQEKWGSSLAADPAFNRNLSLSSQRIVVETAVDVPWDPVFCERPRIMAFPLDAQGTGHYRVWGPLAALDRAALAQYSLLPIHGAGSRGARLPSVPELQRANPNTLLIQHGYLDLFLAWLDHYRRHASTFLVFGQDDNILNVPDRNAMKKSLIADLESRVARAMSSCDRLIVTTEPLVDVYRKYISDIHVIPNALDGSRWTGLVSRRRAGRRPRVGWAGALQHLGDLEWLEPVLRELSREVDWVFMGMCPESLRPYVREFHPAVAFEGYPAKLASLDLDLALAPLELHPFNEAKSDLRILEYGVLGWPVIATDIYPYQGRPVTCIPNDPARWIAAIRERVNDLDALAVEGDRLREWVLTHRMLENNLDAWVRALFSDEVLREFGVIRSLAA